MSCIAGKCVSAIKIPTGSERLKSYKLKQKTSCKSCLDVLFVDVIIIYRFVVCVSGNLFVCRYDYYYFDYFIDKSFKREIFIKIFVCTCTLPRKSVHLPWALPLGGCPRSLG